MLRTVSALSATSFFLAATVAFGQPGRSGPPLDRLRPVDSSGTAARLLSLDRNRDRRISRDEVADEETRSLFARADANRDGLATEAEILSCFPHSSTSSASVPNRPYVDAQPNRDWSEIAPAIPLRPGAYESPNGRAAGTGGGVNPSASFADFEQLQLTAQQRREIEELKRSFDAKLQAILTEQQCRRVTLTY